MASPFFHDNLIFKEWKTALRQSSVAIKLRLIHKKSQRLTLAYMTIKNLKKYNPLFPYDFQDIIFTFFKGVTLGKYMMYIIHILTRDRCTKFPCA